MTTNISYKKAAYNGALVAVAAVFVYSLAVMLYTIIRTSINIYTIMPSSERSTILWTNGMSIAYSVIVFSLLMSVPSLLAGAVAGVILKKLWMRFNPQLHYSKTILISSITSLVLLLLLYLLFYMLLKERITLQYAGTFLFWYVFPAVIFFITVVISGTKLNNYFIKMRYEKANPLNNQENKSPGYVSTIQSRVS
jgi:hypothetical protein